MFTTFEVILLFCIFDFIFQCENVLMLILFYRNQILDEEFINNYECQEFTWAE